MTWFLQNYDPALHADTLVICFGNWSDRWQRRTKPHFASGVSDQMWEDSKPGDTHAHMAPKPAELASSLEPWTPLLPGEYIDGVPKHGWFRKWGYPKW